jgi:hypothetical protein
MRRITSSKYSLGSTSSSRQVCTEIRSQQQTYLLVCYQKVESTRKTFTSWLLTEPYLTVSRHTALSYIFVALNKYQ